MVKIISHQKMVKIICSSGKSIVLENEHVLPIMGALTLNSKLCRIICIFPNDNFFSSEIAMVIFRCKLS